MNAYIKASRGTTDWEKKKKKPHITHNIESIFLTLKFTSYDRQHLNKLYQIMIYEFK